MLRILFFLTLGLLARSDDTTTVTTTTTQEYSSIYCDMFPEPSEVDEGNYGDAMCSLDGTYNEKLILTRILHTDEGQTFLSGAYSFPHTVVTRVQLFNFGRYHGATNAIDILNEGGTGGVEFYVDVFSGKGIRMILEIYGF
ncbi:unnamed protein product [Tenebrio molitor]|jgi:hypothetical protein|nr:unnamed protein product [Tenebrio molitor]